MIYNFIKLISQIPFFLLMFFMVVFIIVGDYYAKKYSIAYNVNLYVILSLSFYMFASIIYLSTLFIKDMMIVTIILETAYILGTLSVGYFIFKEDFNIWQWLGLVLMLIGMIIVLYNE